MAPHSRTFAQKIPWTEEPGRLQSMGSLESDTTSLSLSRIGEGNGNPLQCSCLDGARRPQGRGSLVGCRLWGRTESDTTEATQQQQQQQHDSSIFSFLRNPHTVFHSSSPIYIPINNVQRVLFSPYPHQHLCSDSHSISFFKLRYLSNCGSKSEHNKINALQFESQF